LRHLRCLGGMTLDKGEPTMAAAIAFSDTPEPALISYRVPLPGSHVGRRIVEVDLDLGDIFNVTAKDTGQEIATAAGVRRTDRGVEIDRETARVFLAERLSAAGIDPQRAAITARASDEPAHTTRVIPLQPVFHSARVVAAPGEPSVPPSPGPPPAILVLDEFMEGLRSGRVLLPGRDWAGRPTIYPMDPDAPPEPALFLVERVGISSFLGDYGLGRTVKTFTLLPGESTTISIRTWQSSRQSIQESSSIIDSHEQSARERFADTIQGETTDKATRSKTEKWHVEAEAKASWGFGSAKVSGGASGEYHSSREQFARQASEAVREHAADASSKRELSVSSSSEQTTETGQETTIERVITNVNVRRVLNFVFRELNQEYVTKLHLKDISVAFTNGRLNSWREVPISGLRTLLEEVIEPGMVDHVAQRILKIAGIVFDHKHEPVKTLERITITQDGTTAAVDDPQLVNGEFPPPTDQMYYRFKREPLNQAGDVHPVDGVLLNEERITMRTDSVLVEALLGQADALDEYAMEIQAAAAGEKTLANRRDDLVLQTLGAIADPAQRAEAAAQLLGRCCPEKS
jgi:hypothetical protein